MDSGIIFRIIRWFIWVTKQGCFMQDQISQTGVFGAYSIGVDIASETAKYTVGSERHIAFRPNFACYTQRYQ